MNEIMNFAKIKAAAIARINCQVRSIQIPDVAKLLHRWNKRSVVANFVSVRHSTNNYGREKTKEKLSSQSNASISKQACTNKGARKIKETLNRRKRKILKN